MRLPLRIALIAVCIASIVFLPAMGLLSLVTRAQEGTTVAAWLELVNEARLDEGLNPYSQSRLLTKAAQRRADVIAQSDPDDPQQGADSGNLRERVEEAGYAAWTKEGNQLVVAESVWYGEGTAQDALFSLFENQNDRRNLLSDAYREMGVGIATGDEGQTVYVLSFGARPNVLPIFINDGAASTQNREVAIRLTNERVRPEGEGAGFIGEAIEIRISNQPSFDELPWQSWAPLVSWTLPDAPGEHTVYVQFRDAAGRTAASADSIVLDQGTLASVSPVPITATPTSPPTDTEAPSSPTSELADTRTPPASGAQPAISPESPSPEASGSPSGTSAPAARATPFPTWTPLPSPEPTHTDLQDVADATLSLPTIGDYRRPLAVVGILQGLAIVLGLYWVLRRGKSA